MRQELVGHQNRNCVLVFAILLLLIPIALRWYLQSQDISSFILANQNRVDTSKITSEIHIHQNADYDGQFFYKIAQDPFEISKELGGVKLDNPLYRSQRILYPSISYFLAFGQLDLIPYTLVLTNFLAIFFIWYLFYLLAKKHGLNPWISLIPIIYSGLLIGLSRNLSEPLASMFVLMVFYFYLKHRPVFVSVFMTLVILTKETSMIFFIPIFIVEILRLIKSIIHAEKRFNYLKILLYALPFLIFISWRIYLMQVFNVIDYFPGGGNFTIPLKGIYESIKQLFPLSSIEDYLNVFVFIFHFGFIVLICAMIVRNVKKNLKRKNTCMLIYFSLFLWIIASSMFSFKIYGDFYSLVRVFSSFVLLSYFVMFLNRYKFNRVFVGYVLLLYATTAIRLIFFA